MDDYTNNPNQGGAPASSDDTGQQGGMPQTPSTGGSDEPTPAAPAETPAAPTADGGMTPTSDEHTGGGNGSSQM